MKELSKNLSSILILLSAAFTIPAIGFLILSESSFNLLVFLLSSLLTATILVFIIALFDLMKEEEKESIINKSPSELVPDPEELSGETWKITEEGKLPPEKIEWKEVGGENPSDWGFAESFGKTLEKNGKRVSFCLVKFTSIQKAEEAFLKMSKEQEDTSYPVNRGKNATGLHSEEKKVDGTLFRVKNFLGLTVIGSSEKKESVSYAIHLKDKLTSAESGK